MKKIVAWKNKKDILLEQLEQLKEPIRKRFSIPENHTLDYVSIHYGLRNIPFGKERIKLNHWWVYTMYCSDKWKKLMFDKKVLNKLFNIKENILWISIDCKKKDYLFPVKLLYNISKKKAHYFIVVGKEKEENVTAIIRVSPPENKT